MCHFGGRYSWWEKLTYWKRPWCWARLKAGRDGDDRGRDDWMASLTWWTWVRASSGSWWWRGKPGVLQSMGLQTVRHDWLNWTDDTLCRFLFYVLNLNEEIHSISNLLRFCFYDLVFTFFKLFLCIFKTCKSL